MYMINSSSMHSSSSSSSRVFLSHRRRVTSPPSTRRYSPYVIPLPPTHCHNPLPPLRPYHHQSSSSLYPPPNPLYQRPSFYPTFSCPPLPLSYQFEGPHDHINPSLPPTATYYRWSKPLGPFCTLNTDGSVAKGRSGIGGILRNSHGDPILAFASRCPKMPIYAVELWAIRRGLESALSSGVRYVNVDTDSTDAVKWIYSLPANCPLLGLTLGVAKPHWQQWESSEQATVWQHAAVCLNVLALFFIYLFAIIWVL